MKLTIIDFNRTIYDPVTGGLIDGAYELLEALSLRMKVVLVSKKESDRPEIIEKLGIAPFFSETVFTEQKTAALFLDVIRRHGATPRETMVVGDHIPSEIMCGNEVGAYTVHLRTGTFADQIFRGTYAEPNKTVMRLNEVLALLD